jgi:hypothetical protein
LACEVGLVYDTHKLLQIYPISHAPSTTFLGGWCGQTEAKQAQKSQATGSGVRVRAATEEVSQPQKTRAAAQRVDSILPGESREGNMKGQMDTYFVQVFESASESNAGIRIIGTKCFYNIEDVFEYIRSLEDKSEKYSVYGAVCLLDRS